MTTEPATESEKPRETAIERLLDEGIETNQFPGGVALVGSRTGDETIVVRGERDPRTGGPMTADTVFDCASLTKPIVTATVILRLVEEGVLALSDTVDEYLAVGEAAREEIQLWHLLTHTSGLFNYTYDDAWTDPESARADFFSRSLMEVDPGTRFKYGCNNFVHLGHVAREATGRSLADLAREYVFEPAGMADSRMGALAGHDNPIAVTYEHNYADRALEGEIHDPIARTLDGESGNAGLFATAGDVAAFARALLDSKQSGEGLLSPGTFARMTDNWTSHLDRPHGLGWRRGQSLVPAPTWPLSAIGHTGYTGTSLWLDPESERFACLLTTEVYHGKDNEMGRFRERFYGVAGADW
jgi:CubicO group peptidase (beta-lactamase class C family)